MKTTVCPYDDGGPGRKITSRIKITSKIKSNFNSKTLNFTTNAI